jgi:arginine decarboxylase
MSKTSSLNAFDQALKNAGLAQCNLVKVSSIIPPNCVETKLRQLPIGAITYAVISIAEGRGETISAGIAYGVDEEEGYGLVAEVYGKMDQATVRKELEKRIGEMAKIRGIEFAETKYRIETLDIPQDSYGCALVALVYLI